MTQKQISQNLDEFNKNASFDSPMTTDQSPKPGLKTDLPNLQHFSYQQKHHNKSDNRDLRMSTHNLLTDLNKYNIQRKNTLKKIQRPVGNARNMAVMQSPESTITISGLGTKS